MEKRFSKMSEKDIQAAQLLGIGAISWDDVRYLLGHMVPAREEDIREYALEYAVQLELYMLNYELKSAKGFKILMEHAQLMCQEYDLALCDLSVSEVMNSLYVKVSTGLMTY